MLISQFHRNAEVLLAQSAAIAAMHYIRGRKSKRGNRYGSASSPRHRRTVSDVHACLGARYFKRAYRMCYNSFWKLHAQLKVGIDRAHKQTLEKMKKQRKALLRSRQSGSVRRRLNNPPLPPIPNGRIHSEVRLACALRYFAGGSLYDITSTYGISNTEAMNSVWYVVEATNQMKEW